MLGADAVIDYTRDGFTRQPVRYDAVIDSVANHPLAACLHAVRPGGTLVPNASTPGRWLGGLGRIIKAQLIAPFVRQRIRTCHGIPNQRDLLAVTDLIESAKLTPVIDRTYPLSELPAAIGYLNKDTPAGSPPSTHSPSPSATGSRPPRPTNPDARNTVGETDPRHAINRWRDTGGVGRSPERV